MRAKKKHHKRQHVHDQNFEPGRCSRLNQLHVALIYRKQHAFFCSVVMMTCKNYSQLHLDTSGLLLVLVNFLFHQNA